MNLGDIVDHLNKVFGETELEPKEDVRVIIEGNFQDECRKHSLDVETYNIPQDIGVLKLGHYDLTLVGKVSGKAFEAYEINSETKMKSTYYDHMIRIQRPITVLTEDGRVFHDISLSQHNHYRIFSLINTLAANHAKDYSGMFEKTYQEYS